MHLLHRSSVFGGGGGGGRAPRRGVGSSPRAPPPRQQLFSKSDSIKKRSKGSKSARLRAGLAAALQDLRLAGRHKHRSPLSADAATRATQPSSNQVAQVASHGVDAADPPCAPTAFGSPDWTTASGGGGGALLLLLLLALLALVCVVVLGRAPAVGCCTCAAWWCRGRSAATATGHRQAPPPERRALK